MRGSWVWWLVGVLTVLGVGAVAAYAVVLVPQQREGNRDDAARAAAQALVDRWSAHDPEVFAGAVDYAAVTAGLGDLPAATGTQDAADDGAGAVWPASVELLDVSRDEGSATATLQVTWPFGGDGGWSYTTGLDVDQDDDGTGGGLRAAFDTSGGRWQAAPTVRTVQPDLTDDAVLEAERTVAERGEVLGRDGEPLIEERPVVGIGIQPSRVQDLDAITTTFADVLGVDGAALADRVRAAGPDEFVPVITLRREAYDPVRDVVRAQAGVVFTEGTQPLPPTTAFARATLGRLGPATAEIVEQSDGRVQVGDQTGLSGLQRRYDERLAGTAGFSVVSRAGEQTSGLYSQEPVAGEDLALSLDVTVQDAADQALAALSEGNGNAALVAVDVPSGDVLAVANTPASGLDRALTGTYPPGSTFKTASTLALLGTGLTPDTVVGCPLTATVQGRSFGNVEDSQLGDVPFRTDFARSCNTAFVGLSSSLAPGDLRDAAATLGIGGDWSIGTPAATGDVPVEESDVELAEAVIGQGRVLVSPMAMAQAAATLADGTWTAPRLVLDPAPEPAAAPPALDPARAATVADLMRDVVTDGSATVLLDVPGEPVHAKTGTAEYGTEPPFGTHAWLIGFQGDLAFAVLVEAGSSGGGTAAPVAATFLSLLP